MRTIFHIIRKEFIQLRRDPRMFPILFVAPVIQLIILGYAANLDIKNSPTVVCDMDSTRHSRDFISQFTNSGYFSLIGNVNSIKDIDSAIDRGKAAVVIVIPRGFGNKVISGETVQVQAIFDGAESQQAVICLNYATMIAVRYSRNIILGRLERFPSGVKLAGVNPEIRVWYNPELKSRQFMVPGVVATLLMIMTMMLTSLAIVKEKEMGTMEQLIVTPVRPFELIVGKFLPFILIGFIDIILVLVIAAFWFQVPVKGSVSLLFGLGLVFMMTTLGLGLFISTISRNQQQAMITAVFFMLLMILLSGFIFPVENMPAAIQFFTYLVPMRYFLVIIRAIFLKGVGIETLWDETAAMLVFGLVILTLSVLRFRKKL